jgi:hypothetical protein
VIVILSPCTLVLLNLLCASPGSAPTLGIGRLRERSPMLSVAVIVRLTHDLPFV